MKVVRIPSCWLPVVVLVLLVLGYVALIFIAQPGARIPPLLG